eukprot:2082211-Pleurochrysis_carterae.AAC.1
MLGARRLATFASPPSRSPLRPADLGSSPYAHARWLRHRARAWDRVRRYVPCTLRDTYLGKYVLP